MQTVNQGAMQMPSISSGLAPTGLSGPIFGSDNSQEWLTNEGKLLKLKVTSIRSAITLSVRTNRSAEAVDAGRLCIDSLGGRPSGGNRWRIGVRPDDKLIGLSGTNACNEARTLLKGALDGS